jgi:hypothetical protein
MLCSHALRASTHLLIILLASRSAPAQETAFQPPAVIEDPLVGIPFLLKFGQYF